MSINFEKSETESLEVSVNSLLEKFRKILLCVLIAVVIAVIVIIAGIVIRSNSVESGLEKVESITFSLTNNSATMSADELKSANENAIAQLSELSSSKGIVGIRANLLLADLYFQKGEFEKSRSAYIDSSNIKKNAYTNATAFYNAGVCSEKLNDLDSAIKYYKAASDIKDYLLVDHALFSLARVYEVKNDISSAIEVYEKLNDLHPTSSWALIAKTRLISLK